MTTIEELKRSAEKPELSDCWSCETLRVYLGAAVEHGLDVVHENVPDIYSYAIEAAEALGL